MSRLAFRDFDAYLDALHGVQGRYVPTMRSVRAWQLHTLDLGAVAVMSGQGGAGNIFHGALLPEWAAVIVPLSRPEVIVVDGHRLARHHVAWVAPGREFQFRAFQPTRWMSVNIHRDVLRSHHDDGEHALPKAFEQNHACVASPQAVIDLVSLARRAFRIQAAMPGALDADAARDNLGESFVENALRCVDLPASDATRERGRPKLDRREVLALALGMIEVGMRKTLHLDDLCRAARVSPRTLHTIFMEHFGMPPQRYLAMRRLSAIHEAIRSASGGETVSSICQRFGVWDFGRFARHYREHFGVLPSEDLARRQSRVLH
jgi:AraC family ethanolamine operon transcriptional activator